LTVAKVATIIVIIIITVIRRHDDTLPEINYFIGCRCGAIK
jgi:hypothetical protein